MLNKENNTLNDLELTCKSCELMKKIIESEEEVNITYARKKCANCKKTFKFDSIYQLIKIKSISRGTLSRNGKAPVLYKRYSKIIKQMRAEGKTIAQVAEICNIAISSVNRILKQMREEENKEK